MRRLKRPWCLLRRSLWRVVTFLRALCVRERGREREREGEGEGEGERVRPPSDNYYYATIQVYLIIQRTGGSGEGDH